jgi:hypothetical protein
MNQASVKILLIEEKGSKTNIHEIDYNMINEMKQLKTYRLIEELLITVPRSYIVNFVNNMNAKFKFTEQMELSDKEIIDFLHEH